MSPQPATFCHGSLNGAKGPLQTFALFTDCVFKECGVAGDRSVSVCTGSLSRLTGKVAVRRGQSEEGTQWSCVGTLGLSVLVTTGLWQVAQVHATSHDTWGFPGAGAGSRES